MPRQQVVKVLREESRTERPKRRIKNRKTIMTETESKGREPKGGVGEVSRSQIMPSFVGQIKDFRKEILRNSITYFCFYKITYAEIWKRLAEARMETRK